MNCAPYRDIQVCYSTPQDLEGGGTEFGQDFIKVVSELGATKRVFEFCSGPAFIGFSLLAHKLCESLCLADASEHSATQCRATVERNGLRNVSVYVSDCLDSIPATEQWNLVVSNPPHFASVISQWKGLERFYYDHQWQLHERFYRSVKRFLAPGGRIVMQEHRDGSSVETFEHMIAANGLQIVQVAPSADYPDFYYIHVVADQRAIGPPPPTQLTSGRNRSPTQ
jgi:tRNA1(Val) A37 N6-methylase TrmN6